MDELGMIGGEQTAVCALSGVHRVPANTTLTVLVPWKRLRRQGHETRRRPCDLHQRGGRRV
jgi:hypothetical protein